MGGATYPTEWYPFEKILYELVRKVPAGEAYRRSDDLFRNERIRRGRDPDAPRHRYMSTEDMIRAGRNTIVREFLKNPRAFETNRPGSNRPQPGLPERVIRMVAPLRQAQVNPLMVELDEVKYHNQLLHDALDTLLSYLAQIGHGDAAEVLGVVIPKQFGERGNNTDG